MMTSKTFENNFVAIILSPNSIYDTEPSRSWVLAEYENHKLFFNLFSLLIFWSYLLIFWIGTLAEENVDISIYLGCLVLMYAGFENEQISLISPQAQVSWTSCNISFHLWVAGQ